LDNQTIAAILNTTPASIRVLTANLRVKMGQRRSGRGKLSWTSGKIAGSLTSSKYEESAGEGNSLEHRGILKRGNCRHFANL
jgi:hypothetical protein